MNELLKSILENGSYIIVSGFRQQDARTDRVRESIFDAVSQVVGTSARTALARRGLGMLHEYLPAEEISSIRDKVMPPLRADLFRFACELGEHMLGLEQEFFIDDYTILRINYPYEVGLRSSQSAENPGIGRMDPKLKTRSSSTQKRDEMYDPKAYHKHTPPASWAHGPHKDTWTGHSRRGINLWWAISEVVEENSMIFYPATFGKGYQSDPRSLYLAAGYPLSKPSKMALHPGEMVVFNPELLHATHLNTSGFTRVALSARINSAQPKFDPACFYAREFWHSSIDIKRGQIDVIRQFKREENLEDASTLSGEIPEARVEYPVIYTTLGADGWDMAHLDAFDQRLERQLLELSSGQQVAISRHSGKWVAVQSTCPHLDTSLMDGFCDEKHIYCPAHGVSYDLETGSSSSPLLRLKTYDVEADDTVLRIKARVGA